MLRLCGQDDAPCLPQHGGTSPACPRIDRRARTRRPQMNGGRPVCRPYRTRPWSTWTSVVNRACLLRGRYGKNIRASWGANLEFLQADRAGFFADLARYLKRSKPRFFRYHIGGDFIDADHLLRALNLAREFPEIRFLAFSKRFEIFPPDPHLIPPSFALIASAWDGGAELPSGYAVA
jgi:hypothetical protein